MQQPQILHLDMMWIFRPHRVEKFKLSNDPQFEEKVRDIAGLYLDPPERALVCVSTKKSQIQGFGPNRSDPGRCVPDCRNVKPMITKRHGTTTLFAAFNIFERQSHRQLLAASSR